MPVLVLRPPGLLGSISQSWLGVFPFASL